MECSNEGTFMECDYSAELPMAEQLSEDEEQVVDEETQYQANKLVQFINQLINDEQYEAVGFLFTNAPEAESNFRYLSVVGMELLHGVCLKYINDATYRTKQPLYCCAEELLKVLAQHAPEMSLLLELLELIEEQKSEHVFTSTLRALQVLLLRIGNRKPMCLVWSFNSICNAIQQLPLPEYLYEGYNQKQQELLEQSEQVQSLLVYYVTVGIFLKPILEEVKREKPAPGTIFRKCNLNRRNLLCCFIIQLLGKPLALLDIAVDERNTNKYTKQCVFNLTTSVTQLVGDPFFFLDFVEQRVRWKRRLDADEDVCDMSSNNIFLAEERLPLEGLGIYFYMLLVEEVTLETVPKVYAPLFVFESCLYLVVHLFDQTEPQLHYRGLLFANQLLKSLHDVKISSASLELQVHANFCNALCKLATFTPRLDMRRQSILLLRKYVQQFEEKGKFLLIKNLLCTVKHDGLEGFLITLYKDAVANVLNLGRGGTAVSSAFTKQDFRTIFLRNICHLPDGAETDLIEHLDKIMASVNSLCFFIISDKNNYTGMWDFISDIEKEFMKPLQKALDLSFAHYKAELQYVEQGLDAREEAEQRKQMQILNVNIINAEGENNPKLQIDRKHKLEVLKKSLVSLDMIQNLLALTNNFLEQKRRAFKSGQNHQQACNEVDSL